MTAYGVKTLSLKAVYSVSAYLPVRPRKSIFPEKVNKTEKEIPSEIIQKLPDCAEAICHVIVNRDGVIEANLRSSACDKDFIHGARRRSAAILAADFEPQSHSRYRASVTAIAFGNQAVSRQWRKGDEAEHFWK